MPMRKKILVIDDHPDWRDVLSCYLRGMAYEVVEAQNGLEGMEMAVKEGPNLIILDLDLPDVSGIEVALLLSEDPKTRRIPILVHSAWPAELWRERAIQAGAVEYLSKPTPFPLLTRTIMDIINANLSEKRAYC
jgi:CheY-like chemotaxis protein